MARLARYAPADVPQHIIQRGNNRQVCFARNEDMAVYSAYLQEALDVYRVQCHGWVLMTNHVHLLCTPPADTSISNMMQLLGRKYVRYFNREYGRTGTLFEGRFKSCPVQTERYLLNCLKYIELNPVRAGMVKDPAEYHWSSYQANGLGKVIKQWTPHPEYLRLGATEQERQFHYRQIVQQAVDGALMDEIRTCAQKGLALGSDRFKDEIEKLGNRRQRLMKPGPKEKRPVRQELSREFLL